MRGAHEWITAMRWRRSHWVIAILWLAGLLALQWKLGTGFALAADPDPSLNDQGAYLRLTTENLRYWWPTATDGIRNPLFPFLLKPWYSPDLATFFANAKQVNIVFGLIGTVAFACFWIRCFPFLAALNFTSLTMLAVTLPSGTWVGAEAIFYVGFFFLWLLCAELLTRNPVVLYAVAGAVAAFTYLAKPSTTLLLAIFFGSSALRVIWMKWRGQPDAGWSAKRFLLGCVVFFVALIIPVLPRAIHSAKRFGNAFQNSAQACMWFDDWPSAYAQLGYLNPKMIDRVPPDQRPGPANYFRRNDAGQIVERMKKGISRQAQNFFLPEGTIDKGRKLQKPSLRLPLRMRGAYVLAIGALALVFTVANRGLPDDPAARDRRRAWLWLAATAFAVHFAAFAFYTPIAGGARFIMALYAPVLAALAMAVETRRMQSDRGWRAFAYSAFQCAVAAIMLSHLLWLGMVTRFGEARGAF